MAIVRRIYSVTGQEISCSVIETTMKKMYEKLKKQHKDKPERVEFSHTGRFTGRIIVKTDDGMRTEYNTY